MSNTHIGSSSETDLRDCASKLLMYFFQSICNISQVSDVKSLALRVTSMNLISLERESTVEYVFPCFQLGKLDLDVT